MAQRSVALLDECRRVSADLDHLIADMEMGNPSQARHEGHIDQVEQICSRLRNAARGPGRPVNPPLGRTRDGGCIW